MRTVINYPGRSEGLSGRAFSPALRIGPWVLLAGIVAIDFETMDSVGAKSRPLLAPEIDPAAQWHRVLSNLSLMMDEAGGSIADVVSANVFVTEMRYYFEYEGIRRDYFVEPFPICTAVEVSALVSPEFVIELEATAYIDD